MTSAKTKTEEEKILKEIVKGCYQCGVCTGCCPLGYFLEAYQPSLYIYELLLGDREKVLKEGHLWTCLTCGYCYEKCPQNVFTYIKNASKREPSKQFTRLYNTVWG
jgi:heterodisulfide reductase subunit C